jgi:hypothetical protein
MLDGLENNLGHRGRNHGIPRWHLASAASIDGGNRTSEMSLAILSSVSKALVDLLKRESVLSIGDTDSTWLPADHLLSCPVLPTLNHG